MAYSEELVNRIREYLTDLPDVEEKKMFRGITFMVNGKMCVSVGGDEIMCRVDPAIYNEVIKKNGTREMIRQDKVLKGFVFVNNDVIKTKKDMDYWMKLALDFNSNAKASKKRK